MGAAGARARTHVFVDVVTCLQAGDRTTLPLIACCHLSAAAAAAPQLPAGAGVLPHINSVTPRCVHAPTGRDGACDGTPVLLRGSNLVGPGRKLLVRHAGKQRGTGAEGRMNGRPPG